MTVRPRIAVGGLAHESNSFAPLPADLAAFEAAGIGRGARLLEQGAANAPLAGFVAAARGDAELLPTTFAWAQPSGPVTRDAFERLAGEVLAGVREAGPLDAVFLDLHGAMLLEDGDDGEGELLTRLRDIVGADLLVVCALDFHANVSSQMVDLSDGLVGYRTYPHVDMAATGARAWRLLDRRLAAGRAPAKAVASGGYLTPTVAQCTEVEPMRGLQALSSALEAADPALWSCDLLAGFPLADTPCCGASAVAYADDAASAQAAVGRLASAYADAEPAFGAPVLSPAEALVRARSALAAGGRGPVVLADTQDNPGGGGPGDTVGLLRAMIDAELPDAALGVLTDPQAAAAAHAAGLGAELDLTLGAKRGGADEPPVVARVRVTGLSDGRGVHRGPFLRGAGFRLGRAAALRIGGVTVVVGTHPVQCADREMFRIVGVDPDGLGVVAVKSSVHFRADFGPGAREVLVVAAPGPVKADHRELSFHSLRPGLRLMPGLAEGVVPAPH